MADQQAMTRNLFSNINDSTRLAGYNRLALLLFSINDKQLHGINVFKVQEVVPAPTLTPVPGASRQVIGIARIRDRNVPVLDLSAAIGGPSLQDPAYVIVTEFNRTIQGFAVSAVDRIVNVDVGDVHPPPRAGQDDSYLTAVTRWDNHLIEVVDVERILSDVIGGEYTSNKRGDVCLTKLAAGRKVMVADDSRVARSQIARTLESLGLESILVNDGDEAWRMLNSIAAQGPVSEQLLMLISDVEMPGMDGYRLTTEVRADNRFAGLYVVLHTSLSGVFNNALVKQVGADRFIPKFNADELASHVVERVQAMTAPQAHAA
ncbi:MAG: chemotaxis protein [Oceanococcus sp.]